MATKKISNKKRPFRVTPLILTICIACALLLGLLIGLLIPTPGASIPSTPLSAVKVTDLTVNSVAPEDPVVLRFKLNGIPEGTQLSLILKHDGKTDYLDCSADGDYYGCKIDSLTEKPTHVTLVLVHEGASIYLPLVRNLSRTAGSIGYLAVWDYQ